MAQREQVVNARARARLGSTLKEKYKLERLLGTGGMAAVYGATHRNTKRFAVKVLHPELSLNEDLRTRFLREGYIANSVGHPGAVTVLDDDVTDDGAAFLVMELLDGEPLDALAHRLGGCLEPAIVLALTVQTLEVLVAAHARGIVHRDIKPENLFLTRAGEVKVLDFGVARLRDASPGTFTGFALGTPAYMAPEQALGRTDEIDGRTDLWALGATMFRLLSGRFVHDLPSIQEAMIRAATCRAPPLGEAWPGAPKDVSRVVDKALAFARQDRWPSAEAMGEAVREAYRALEGIDLGPEVLRSVAAKIQISFPPDGASDPCAPTALAPAPSPARVEARMSDGASAGVYATGLTGSSSQPPVTPSLGVTWRFVAIAVVCVGLGALMGVAARRGAPSPQPSHSDAIREAAAPSPPPPPPVVEIPAVPLPPASVAPTPRHARTGPTPPKAAPSASASASSPTPRPYDDFDRQ